MALTLPTQRIGSLGVVAVLATVLVALAIGLVVVNLRLEALARAQADTQLRTAHFGPVHALQTWVAELQPTLARIRENSALGESAGALVEADAGGVPVVTAASPRNAVESWFDRLRDTTGASSVELVNPIGTRVAVTTQATLGTQNPAMAQQRFRDTLATGDFAFSTPVPSVTEASVTEATAPDNTPMLYAGVPLSRPGEAAYAYVLLGIEADDVLSERLELGLFGRSGHTFLVDGDGKVVSDTRLDDILVDQGRLPPNPGRGALRLRAVEAGTSTLTVPARSVVSASSGVDTSPYRSMTGVDSIGAWSWLPELGVGVVTEVAAEEAFLELEVAKRIVTWLWVGAMLLVLGLGLMFERARRGAVAHASELRAVAMFDSLTGLPNRHAFRYYLEQALQRAARNRSSTALLFIDLDNFKRINDSLGHDVGDELLVEVARRLDQCVRGTDMVTHDLERGVADESEHDNQASRVARLGGDEFVLMLSDLRDSRGAAVVAQRMLDVLAEPVVLRQQSLLVSPSIGIALAPEDGQDVETLVKSADIAMYAAKQGGRNRYEFFSASMSETAAEHLLLESKLREALDANAVDVHYQPVIDAATGATASAEALARWHDAELGDISPGRFVPIAEMSGLIGALGSRVLRRACEDAARWQTVVGPTGSAPGVAINVASEQFLDPGFVDEVHRVLVETGLAPHLLNLEVTERIALANTDDITTALRSLKALGVTISMDDFGTGYSSLSYLSKLPIDVIKIDASFVRGLPVDEQAVALTATIIAMGTRLGKQLVAEGVETPAQQQFLTAEGAHKLQGWLFAEAMPASEFERWLQTHPRSPADVASLAG